MLAHGIWSHLLYFYVVNKGSCYVEDWIFLTCLERKANEISGYII